MSRPGRKSRRAATENLESLWASHGNEFRDPHQVVTQWQYPAAFDPGLLTQRTRGPFWSLLDQLGVTLIVTREYEHLVAALAMRRGRKRTSYLRLPHPNGLAYDSQRRVVHVASTRNPNMVFDLRPAGDARAAGGVDGRFAGLLTPVRARYLPGSLYVHDLAMVGRRLHANAVAQNAVVELPDAGGYRVKWWPRTIDGADGGDPRLDRNYLQLNSIAAGKTLRSSFFTASAEIPSARRPGHLNFPVDRRGVLFSGATRDVVARGLTRPHSARFHGKRIWLDNSGYGELGFVADGAFEVVAQLPGWTRGLCFVGDVAFVATSRVIPRFRHYAPGLDVESSTCGVHAVDIATGAVIASLIWPRGNQIFAVEAVPTELTHGFPFEMGRARSSEFVRDFYSSARTDG